jgi:hypothetical protein
VFGTLKLNVHNRLRFRNLYGKNHWFFIYQNVRKIDFRISKRKKPARLIIKTHSSEHQRKKAHTINTRVYGMPLKSNGTVFINAEWANHRKTKPNRYNALWCRTRLPELGTSAGFAGFLLLPTKLHTRVYPKVSGLAACCEKCKCYSSLPLGAVVSLFCKSV